MSEPTFIPREPDTYSDADFEAAERARIRAAMGDRITNHDLNVKLDAVIGMLNQYGEAIAQVVAVAEEVKEKADPVLQGLMSNPMVKMLVGKAGR